MKVVILGSGQLGMFLSQVCDRYGYNSVLVNCVSVADVPTSIAHKYIPVDWKDLSSLDLILNDADVITWETEHIPTHVIHHIRKYNTVAPPPDSLIEIQDRALQKSLIDRIQDDYKDIHFANAWIRIESENGLRNAARLFGYPFVIKSRFGGYDGHGLRIIRSSSDLIKSYELISSGSGVIAERFINYKYEISSVFVTDGSDIRFWDLVQNNHKDGILVETIAPSSVTRELNYKVQLICNRIVKALNYKGVMAIEFFVEDEDNIIINEIAPRVHNSGHWTLDGSCTSQFENHIRAISGLSILSTETIVKCKMINCIGNLIPLNDLPESASFYDYGKIKKPGRKLGHYTTRELK